tara:strand:- start:2026 stop:2622 length:597 start_codon:yes stop_codon:yes gene_type:complete
VDSRPDSAEWLALRGTFHEAEARGLLLSYRRRRWSRSEEFAGWLADGVLPSLSMDQALSLYTASGGNRRTEFKGNAIEEVRDSLDFLLYDTVMLEGRFTECAAEGGAYKLAGAGKEFVSYLLCLRDPSLFAVWNSWAERTLRKLGMYPEGMRKGPLGVRYLDVLEALAMVRRRLGLGDFRAVDEFSYAITRAGGGPTG